MNYIQTRCSIADTFGKELAFACDLPLPDTSRMAVQTASLGKLCAWLGRTGY